ncbi:MAG: cation:proton antiporter [Chitinophagaceae bacterium]|nr:cation:proton antiporter [Chitinophagaceae bacterium]
MIHLPELIRDLGLILGAAAIVTILFKWLKQPIVLGYLIAGFLVGPHFHLIPSIAEKHNIDVWAEIGVIFLLFGLGLEFSFKKLLRVGIPASITALLEVAGMVFLGYMIGSLMGWSKMDSIFLGGVLCISSTTIIIRAFEELGVQGKQFAGLVFGILIVEDLLAILLMVLLTTISVSNQFSGSEMLFSIVKLIFFLILWFILGIFFIPTLLRWAKKLMTEEMLLITSLALCIMMVWLASMVGFSPALGAFIMGSILAETVYAEKIEHLLKPVKDLFGAVFFVSVGMLFNPEVVVDYTWTVVIIILATIFGKMITTSFGALLSGQPLKLSVQTGFSLAQIGEFSFIIATLGYSLKVTSEFLYPIAVAVSAITTFTTPYLMKMAEPFYNWLNKILPPAWIKSLNRYSNRSQKQTITNEWQRYIRSWIIQTIILTVFVTAIVLLSSYYILPYTRTRLGDNTWITIVVAIGTAIIIAPFIWSLILPYKRDLLEEILKTQKFKGSIYLLHLLKIVIAIFLVGFLLDSFFSAKISLLVTVLMFITLLFFSKKIQLLYKKIKGQFLINYNAREDAEKSNLQSELAPWDTHIVAFQVNAHCPGIGKTLQELAWRETYGINVARILRGNKIINAPGRYERIFPTDLLSIIGTDEQLMTFNQAINIPDVKETVTTSKKNEIILGHITIAPNAVLAEQTIRQSGIREKTHGIIVGIETNGQRIINPESTYTMKAGDILWIVGDKLRISTLKKATEETEEKNETNKT